MDLSELAILIGCAVAVFGVVQVVRHDDSRRLLGGRTPIQTLLENPDIRLICIGLVIAVVGWLVSVLD
jgi:hypothetical protein